MSDQAINTLEFSKTLRKRGIDKDNRKLLISKLAGSDQEADLTVPPNCNGFGRIRHFKRSRSKNWPNNPLPIDPVVHALGLGETDGVRAQVFQNAICNWRCWYCFVPYNLLTGDPARSSFFTAKELVELYKKEKDRPVLIDLSGGQPDLIPEWIPWMMEALIEQGLQDSVYLWSDDNLSNDYFWQYLTEKEIDLVKSYKNYSRVCCFKGYNQVSFAFNTKAEKSRFDEQFALMKRLHKLGIDLYAYATFTTPNIEGLIEDMRGFVDKLQEIHVNLPLRLVPLEIEEFGPVHSRMNEETKKAIKNQYLAVNAWTEELRKRYSSTMLSEKMNLIRL